MSQQTFHRLYPPSEPREGTAYWLLFSGEEILLSPKTPLALLEGTTSQIGGYSPAERFYLGNLGDTPVMFAKLPSETPIVDLQRYGLRTLLAEAPEIAQLAGYASQLLNWQRISAYCPACATPLERNDGWGKVCPACKYVCYPPVSPAIIVLIHDDQGRVLLSTKPGWGKRYSLIAGFVEPGESFEECVVREVMEEVGVHVDQLRYIDSQAWPFPHQIMVGYMAHYCGGEIAIDTTELADARWFTRDDLPELPAPHTIARQLIERWRTQQ